MIPKDCLTQKHHQSARPCSGAVLNALQLFSRWPKAEAITKRGKWHFPTFLGIGPVMVTDRWLPHTSDRPLPCVYFLIANSSHSGSPNIVQRTVRKVSRCPGLSLWLWAAASIHPFLLKSQGAEPENYRETAP